MTFYMIMYSMQNFSHQIAWCQRLLSVTDAIFCKSALWHCGTEKVSMKKKKRKSQHAQLDFTEKNKEPLRRETEHFGVKTMT